MSEIVDVGHFSLLTYDQGFEYLSTDSRSSKLYQSIVDFDEAPPRTEEDARNAYVLRRDVIDTLIAMHGMESFRPVVENGAMLLRTVPTISLRELELYLIHEGRVGAINDLVTSC